MNRGVRSGVVVAIAIAIAVTVTVVGAGVGAAAPTREAKDACGLLTRAEIERVFAKRVGRAKRSLPEQVRDQECAWQVGGSASNRGAGSVRTSLFRGPIANQNYEGLEARGEAVAGLGDGAVYVSDPNLCCAIHVLDGSTLIAVQGVFIDGPAIGKRPKLVDQLTRLAKRALERV